MVDSVSFQTKARTIDHLGREQIADCPTAISELWKNSYDAYARNVELHIFDGDTPVCSLVDDGHGMERQEFENKWLTIGTESKATSGGRSEEDRDGLAYRVKQGQKGIGRLSCAALGKLLLLISKRKDSPFVATLIDWRLFENPFLLLHDLMIPIIEFDHKDELSALIPSLFDGLMGNLWGDGKDESRDSRLDTGWQLFAEQELAEGKQTTKSTIEKTILEDSFSERHFSSWSVWNGESAKGTAMFITDIHDDLEAQISKESVQDIDDGPSIRARELIRQTLSNFADPFAKEDEPHILDFSNSITAWNGKLQRPIIDKVRDFDLSNLEDLEHLVEGLVDEEGYFHGRVKAFGKWYEDVIIKPGAKYKMRKDSRFGPFSLRVGSYEDMPRNTTLPGDLHTLFKEQSERYGGFMIYRDGLRVMPYGREDNDYFEIEKRRTLNAGRYFWSNRRTFGRISITREHNSNLKDKAGREGLIDNRASKLFREIVVKILIDVADRYFGGKSEIRKPTIADLQAKKSVEKAEQDRKKLLKKERRRVKSSIRQDQPLLQNLVDNLCTLADEISRGGHLDSEESARDIKDRISEYSTKSQNFSLSPLPSSLGSVEDEYKFYRRLELRAKELIKQLDSSVNTALAKHVETSDYEIAQGVLKSKAGQLHATIRGLAKEGREILQQESENFKTLVDQRNKEYHLAFAETMEDLKLGKVSLALVLEKLDDEFYKQEIENVQRLQPYVTALTNIRDQIDLEGLAIHSMNETEKWKAEAGRLHQLAQLGITVEIIGHEIEGLDMTISRGLNTLRNAEFTANQNQAYQNVIHAQESLSDKWRFLSPLKLSGEKTRKRITGKAIFDYVQHYFSNSLVEKDISLSATSTFTQISIREQPARLYPVFINLVNNSRYWVQRGECSTKEIIMDYRDGEIIVADNGPGVDRDDFDQLFTLFFTRKQRGGRGVGLYLCRQNLQAGGHKIRYETNKEQMILPGANFVVLLKGIIND